MSIEEGPATDTLRTSTPSAVARSIAETRSALEQPSSAGSGAAQQALYAAMRARGATPPKSPTVRPFTRTDTSELPAATEATWVPWPTTSRGDRLSDDRMRSAPKPATHQPEPTTLRLHAAADQSLLVAHVPE